MARISSILEAALILAISLSSATPALAAAARAGAAAARGGGAANSGGFTQCAPSKPESVDKRDAGSEGDKCLVDENVWAVEGSPDDRYYVEPKSGLAVSPILADGLFTRFEAEEICAAYSAGNLSWKLPSANIDEVNALHGLANRNGDFVTVENDEGMNILNRYDLVPARAAVICVGAHDARIGR